MTINGYTDVSFSANLGNRKSTTGYLFLMMGEQLTYGSETENDCRINRGIGVDGSAYVSKKVVYLSNFMMVLVENTKLCADQLS